MHRRWLLRAMFLGLFVFNCQRASAIEQVFLSVLIDDAELSVGQETVIHVFAEVADGQVDNGIYAYALEFLFDVPGFVELYSVSVLGSPDPFFSSAGLIDVNGLHDVYGGDGGYFLDQSRGIGDPFEILQLAVRGVAVGTVSLSAGPASVSSLVGVPDGFLVQEPGEVNVDFGDPSIIVVIPEPAGLCLIALALVFPVARRK